MGTMSIKHLTDPAQTTAKPPTAGGPREKGPYRGVKGAPKGPYW